MISLADWKPAVFDPALERQYRDEQLNRVVLLGRLGSIIAAVSFLAYGAWDLLLDPGALSRTWPYRVAVVVYFAATFRVGDWRVMRRNPGLWPVFVCANYLVVGVSFVLILRELPGSFVAGVPGFILGMIFVPVVVITFAQAILVLAPLIAAPILLMALYGASTFELVNAAAWIGGGGGFAIGFAYLLDAINRRAFQLEKSLEIERQRSEALLLNILPAKIAERLKTSQKTIADNFDAATVLFADIVGFTELSRRLTAGEVVAILNDLFSRFDLLAAAHGVEKIKTIGDGYMAAAGIPTGRSDHAEAVAALALDMRAAVAAFREERGLNLRLRIGVHSGSVVAGVIGTHKFAYDLWGDTVNVASRMESHGLADEIQISAETRDLLPATYRVEERGSINIKGHNARPAFLLKEKRGG
jgi:class 3 adenylate cyclase